MKVPETEREAVNRVGRLRGWLFRASQRPAGHDHLVTTQRYAHATETDLRAAVARLGGSRTVTSAVTGR